MNIHDVHHDTPNVTLISPDAHVTALLSHLLRVVRHFIGAVCVTEIAGASNVAADWLPRDLALRREGRNPHVRRLQPGCRHTEDYPDDKAGLQAMRRQEIYQWNNFDRDRVTPEVLLPDRPV